jgi:ketosteroid isomerase-like protein
MSSQDNNKALARCFLAAFANGDLHTLDELLAPEFINHNPLPGRDPGREGYMRTVAEKHDAFSDIRHAIEYQTTDVYVGGVYKVPSGIEKPADDPSRGLLVGLLSEGHAPQA